MSRIAAAFENLSREHRKGFIPFIVAGDPNLESTELIISELAEAGATVIELGVPFSDPMADGLVIQRASQRALKQGTCIEDILQMVRRVRLKFATPIVLFSYYNPLLQYGLGRLAADAAEVGVDGVLVTDLTPEEAGEFAAVLKARDMDLIFLVAPTSSDDRIRLVSERASGFIYVVSRAGVTGQRETLNEAAERLVERVRHFSELPVAIGFGISSREQVAAVWRYADAAVVGSALVAECDGANASDLAARVGKLARLLAGTSA